MAADILKKRLILAVGKLVRARPDLFHHWRGGGDGTKKNQSCVTIIQYARSSDVGDPFLRQILDALLRGRKFPDEIKHPKPLDLAGIGAALGLGEASEPNSLCHQFANLVRGIAWTVDAEYYRRLAAEPDPELLPAERKRFLELHTNLAYSSLRNAAACYDAAWQVSTQKVKGIGADPTVQPGSVSDFLLRSRSVMTDVTYSTWNILHRLLTALRPDDHGHTPASPDRAPEEPGNQLTVLFYDEQYNRGVLGPIRVCLSASDFPAVVPDPLTFGVTVLDKAMQQSIRAGFRCCRTSLLSRGYDRSPAILIRPEFPVDTNVSFSVLGGGSAGGLLAAGMIITASPEQTRSKVQRGRTATCAIRAIEGNDETELNPADVQLMPVGHVPEKMRAIFHSGGSGIDGVALVAANRIEWENYFGYSSVPKPFDVASLGDLVTFLRGDTVIEEELKSHAAKGHREWLSFIEAASDPKARNTAKEDSQTHRFDCFVPPRFQVEGPLRDREHRQQTPQSNRERLDVPGRGDNALLALLRLSLLHDPQHRWNSEVAWLTPGKSLVLFDRAGAGKTVTTFRLKHFLTSDEARDTLFGGSAPLVVRFEGKIPRDVRDTPLRSVREILNHLVALDITGQPQPLQEAIDDATRAVNYAFQERRVVIIVDGFDQFSLSERQQIQHMMDTQDGKNNCRWIVASRQHTINEMSDLFTDGKWLRVTIEPFDQDQQDEYFRLPLGNPIGKRWLKTIGVPDLAGLADEHPNRQLARSIRRSMDELLGLPMVLSQIRLLIETSGSDDNGLPLFQNLSELSVLTARRLLEQALEKTLTDDDPQKRRDAIRFLEEGTRKFGLTQPQQVVLLEKVLSLIAFQMMLLLNMNGDIAASRYKWFSRLCRDRYLRPFQQRINREEDSTEREALQGEKKLARKKWDWAMQVLRTIELNHQATMDYHDDVIGIAFRSRKVMECYAARFLTSYATPFDVFGTDKTFEQIVVNPGDEWDFHALCLQSPEKILPDTILELEDNANAFRTLCAWDFTTHDDWESTWQLAIDMPLNAPRGFESTIKVDADAMLKSLSALFLRPKAYPARDIRPTELIYRCWHLFEYDERLLRERRFPCGGRLILGKELVTQLGPAEFETHGRRLLLGYITGNKSVCQMRDGVLATFRKSGDDLRAAIAARRNGVLQQNGQRVAIPFDAAERSKVLSEWQVQSSTEKSLTLLQCPPQSWLNAFEESSKQALGMIPDPRINSVIRGPEAVMPVLLQAATVTRAMYRVFDAAFETTQSVDRNNRPIAGETLARASAFDSHKNGDEFPVVCTHWFDAWVFCKWLGPQYRLPTEFEWEHACRAGTTTLYHFGNGLNGTQANCDGNHPHGVDGHGKLLSKGPYVQRTTPVGLATYPCNGYGLFDVHGNVWEWCEKRYDDAEDYLGAFRYLRGGSWDSLAGPCRSRERDGSTPVFRRYDIGFRLCME